MSDEELTALPATPGADAQIAAASMLAIVDLVLFLHDKGVIDKNEMGARWRQTAQRDDLGNTPAMKRLFEHMANGVLTAVKRP